MKNSRREPRFDVALDASFCRGPAVRRRVRITNLSAAGCRFVSPTRRLGMGTLITLAFGRAGSFDAKVRWRMDNTHGVRLDRPLRPAVLDHIRLFLSDEPALVAEREPMYG